MKTKKNIKKIDEIAPASELHALGDFINQQKDYKKAYLARMYTGTKLLEFRKQIDEGPITIQWMGIPFPKELLVWEHDIVLDQYRDLILEEKRLKTSLMDYYGLTTKQLDKLLNKGVYVKVMRKRNLGGQDYVG